MGKGRRNKVLKLTPAKIKYIIRAKTNSLSFRIISIEMKVSIRTVNRVWGHWMKNKEPLTLKKFGRPKTYLNDPDRLLILKIHKEQNCGARRLEKVIEHKYGQHIPHNSIHKILLENDLAHEDKKKKKRRKLWIRYPERTASKFDALYYRGLLEKAWAEVAFMFPKDYGRHSHEIRPRAERSALSPKQIVNLEGVKSRWQEVSAHKKRSDLGAKVVPYYAGIGYLRTPKNPLKWVPCLYTIYIGQALNRG